MKKWLALKKSPLEDQAWVTMQYSISVSHLSLAQILWNFVCPYFILQLKNLTKYFELLQMHNGDNTALYAKCENDGTIETNFIDERFSAIWV